MVEDRGSYCILEKRESDERMVGDKSNRYKPKCKCITLLKVKCKRIIWTCAIGLLVLPEAFMQHLRHRGTSFEGETEGAE